DADSVLVLRGCGPKGYPGMTEVSNMPLPAKLLEQGVRDMVRICDGRMSGTAYGTVVLHVAPEAAAGGPLGRVQTGAWVELDGYAGMPEVSSMPLPAKRRDQAVRDMVSICDGRMSGTAYGTVVLHVAPEAAAGGPLGLVQTGDWIELDVAARRLDIDVPAEELAARTPSAAMTDAFAAPTRGWEKLYVEHVQQADTGADLDFLIGSSGSEVLRESH